MHLWSSTQSKLQECQKRIGEMEAELQKANNKVCHTGHLLNQLTAKVKMITPVSWAPKRARPIVLWECIYFSKWWFLILNIEQSLLNLSMLWLSHYHHQFSPLIICSFFSCRRVKVFNNSWVFWISSCCCWGKLTNCAFRSCIKPDQILARYKSKVRETQHPFHLCHEFTLYSLSSSTPHL